MIHSRHLSIKDYTYTLPEDKIAFYPLFGRDRSKLLIYADGIIAEDTYRNLADYLPANTLMLFNNTKVVEARLLFKKNTGGIIEIFCLEPDEKYADIQTAMQQQHQVLWKCLVGGASKWTKGLILKKEILTGSTKINLQASYIEKRNDHFIIALSWDDDTISFAEILHLAGAIPLPPYIKRHAESADAETYQTIYAEHDGSVAAPTAGLHFTKNIFKSLQQKKIKKDFVTLHVGAGTFKPVKAESMDKHDMHAEYIHVHKTTIENIIENKKNSIIAVGTTSCRTIESLYWLGVKTKLNPGISQENLILHQWECYDLEKENVSVHNALEALLKWLSKKEMTELFSKTQIIMAPGYKSKIIDALITNFHQPQSTLLLLVASIIGEDWKKVYEYALKNDYRFLSYGDGSLLWVNKS